MKSYMYTKEVIFLTVTNSKSAIATTREPLKVLPLNEIKAVENGFPVELMTLSDCNMKQSARQL